MGHEWHSNPEPIVPVNRSWYLGDAVSVGFDPGLKRAGIAAVRWRKGRVTFIASADFGSDSWVLLPERLDKLRAWMDWFVGTDTGINRHAAVFAIEDQSFSRLPGKLGGRTNAAASQPLIAQSVALAWAQAWASEIVMVQPQSVRKAALGTSASFRCPRGVPPNLREHARRQHDKRVCAATERAVRQLVRGVPDGLSVHEIDAICCCLAARTKGRRM